MCPRDPHLHIMWDTALHTLHSMPMCLTHGTHMHTMRGLHLQFLSSLCMACICTHILYTACICIHTLYVHAWHVHAHPCPCTARCPSHAINPLHRATAMPLDVGALVPQGVFTLRACLTSNACYVLAHNPVPSKSRTPGTARLAQHVPMPHACHASACKHHAWLARHAPACTHYAWHACACTRTLSTACIYTYTPCTPCMRMHISDPCIASPP